MLQVSELNLPPPELQFHVGLLSEVSDLLSHLQRHLCRRNYHEIITKVEIGLPIPQLPEADGAEWREEENEVGSWRKNHFGGFQENIDLRMSETCRSVSDQESVMSGKNNDEELKLVDCEGCGADPVSGRGGVEDVESYCERTKEFFGKTGDVRDEVLENSLDQSGSHQGDDSTDQTENVQLREGEWRSRESRVNGPFLAATKSQSPIQGKFDSTDLVQEESQVSNDWKYLNQIGEFSEDSEQSCGRGNLAFDGLTRGRESSQNQMRTDLVPNDLIQNEQVSGVSDVLIDQDFILVGQTQKDLTKANISEPDLPNDYNEMNERHILPSEGTQEEQDGEELQNNQVEEIQDHSAHEQVASTNEQDPEEFQTQRNSIQSPVELNDNRTEMQGLVRLERTQDRSESERPSSEDISDIVGSVEIITHQEHKYESQQMDSAEDEHLFQLSHSSGKLKTGDDNDDEDMPRYDSWLLRGADPLVIAQDGAAR